MVDKAVSGIGRELRYFEYKFRKNQQKKKKTGKNGNLSNQGLAWADGAQSSDVQSTNEELRKAVPDSSGEEALQIQVALAMSREEEQERDRQSESDRLRLEMAIKESKEQAEYAKKTEQVKNQPSLLDLSMSARKPIGASAPRAAPPGGDNPWGTQVPVDSFANRNVVTPATAPAVASRNVVSADLWANQPTRDPWAGTPAPVVSAPVVNPWGDVASADPWANQPIQDPWRGTPAPVVSAPVGNPWGTVTQPAAVPAASIPQSNGWHNAPSQKPAQMGTWGAVDNVSSVSATPQNAAWGMPTSTPSAGPQNTACGDPDPFLSLSQPQDPPKPMYDPFSGTTSIAPAQSSALYSAPAASNPSIAPFGSESGDIFSAPPFDPLKDFDNLHIGSNEPEPVILTHDLAPGASVAKDLFPRTLKPNMVPQNSNSAPVTQTAANTKSPNSFLGENSSLVNLDSGWRYQAPYSTKPLSGSQNPFQQTGPSKTLNEMMGRHSSGFQ